MFYLASLFAVACLSAIESPGPRPNVLLIFMDNVGYGDLGCYGNRQVRTPRLDALAAQGVRCTDFYIGSPSCTPSRGALLTGRHPERTGLNWQMRPEESFKEGLPRGEKLLPQYLKSRSRNLSPPRDLPAAQRGGSGSGIGSEPLGYATGAFGKWNIGFGPGVRPTERGFDEFLGHASGNIHYFTHRYHGWNDMRRGIEEVHLEGRYSTDLFADAAIDFVRRRQTQPWLVYLPFNAAHYVGQHNCEPGEKVQWQAPTEYLKLYGSGDEEPDQQKRFNAVLTALDAAIGRVLDTLDELHLAERTIVIALADNGAFMLPGKGKEVQSNLPLRDGGATTYEGGIRVPAIVRWPGRIRPGSVCREMLSSMDLLPMIVLAAGGQLPQDRVLDGRDPTAALAGEGPSPHARLAWVWGKWQAMRQGPYKIVRPPKQSQWELYDLSRDLGETNNLAAQQPQRLHSMVAEFERWHEEVRSPGVAAPGP